MHAPGDRVFALLLILYILSPRNCIKYGWLSHHAYADNSQYTMHYTFSQISFTLPNETKVAELRL